MIHGWGIAWEIAFRWMSLDLADDKSTLVQKMAWYCQATSHYLNLITVPPWVNIWSYIFQPCMVAICIPVHRHIRAYWLCLFPQRLRNMSCLVTVYMCKRISPLFYCCYLGLQQWIHHVSWISWNGSPRYVSWYEKINQDTYRDHILYSVILWHLIVSDKIYKNSI